MKYSMLYLKYISSLLNQSAAQEVIIQNNKHNYRENI